MKRLLPFLAFLLVILSAAYWLWLTTSRRAAEPGKFREKGHAVMEREKVPEIPARPDVTLPAPDPIKGASDKPAPLMPGSSRIAALPEEQRPMLRDDAAAAPPYTVKRVIFSEDQQLDGNGRFLRTQLIETEMKYAYLRVEEEVLRVGHAGDEYVLNRTAAVADHLIVEPQPGEIAAFEQWARSNNVDFRRRGSASPIYLIGVPMRTLEDLPNAVARFKAERFISAADPDYVVQPSLTPNDSRFSSLWGMNNTGQTGGLADADIDLTEAWNSASPTGGSAVVVGVIDTGIDYNHPDLAANMWANPGEIAGNGVDDDANGYVDDVRGWDFINNDNDPADDHYHGTHVAGTIGAAGNNNQGVAGVVWNAKLMPLKFLGTSGGYTSDAIEAIDYATQKGARLTNNSWGGGGFSQSVQNAIQRAQDSGVLFVAAAGNSSLNTDDKPSYPSSYPNDIIVSVAATDHRDALASFSNFGVTSVDVAAPGVGVLSTFPTVATAKMTQSGLPVSYGSISGTSMAAPHVTGVAALLWKHQPGLTALEVKSRILSRGDVIFPLLSKLQSGRRLNALLAVGSGTPALPQLQFTSISAAFAGGNGDNVLNPGETLELTPELINIGGQTATSVTLDVTPQTTGVSVSGAATRALADIAPIGRGEPSSPLTFAVSSSVAGNVQVNVQVTARWATGQQVTQNYSTVIVVPQPRREVELTWAPGEPLADPVRQRVYLLDKTNLRVLSIDTTTGAVAAWAGIAGSPEIAPPVENGALRTGMLAVSHSGSTLWVALTGAKKIQAFNLPSLTPGATLNLSFSPVSLAQSANNRLFATSTDYWGPIRELNPATGAILRIFDKGGTNGTFYMHSLLRLNANGTRLLAGETGLSVGGTGYIYEYDVAGTGAPPTPLKRPCQQVYMKDFAADSARQRIYTVSGGIYGVQMTDTVSGAFDTVWPFASAYGAAVEMPVGSNVAYGASADPYDGEITRFDASTGAALTRVIVGTDACSIPARALAVTSGGIQAYVKSQWTGDPLEGVDGYRYFFGIIGLGSVNLGNLPPPVATPPSLALSHVEFSDVDANRDGVAGPGERVRLLPSFRNAGGLPAVSPVVTCSTTTPGVSVRAPATLAMNDVPAYGAEAPASEFQLDIAAAVADGTVVDVTFTATHNGTVSSIATWRFTVRTVVPNTITTDHFWALGKVIADHTRNVAYLQDRQNHRILALDTSLGVAVAACPLEGPAKVGSFSPQLGGMALSPDGSKLYVAISQARMIQVIGLPEFNTLAAWPLGFEPKFLAADAQGRVYATRSGANPVQINPLNGAVLGSFGSSGQLYMRTTPDGATLFVSSGSNVIQRFNASGAGLPTLIGSTTVGAFGVKAEDFEWDAAGQRFIVAANTVTVHAVTVSGVVSAWNVGSTFLNNVAVPPDGSQVWAGVSSSSGDGMLRLFNPSTGGVLKDFDIDAASGYNLLDDGLAVTPNGRAVYVLQSWVGTYTPSADGYTYKVGIIGSGLADLDLPLDGGASFALKSCVVAAPFSDPDQGDTYVNPGETVRLTPTIKNQSLGAALGVQVRVVSTSAKVTVVTTGAASAGTMGPYASFTPGTPFQVHIGSTAVDGEELLVRFRVSRTGAPDEYLDYPINVFKPAAVNTAALAYETGEITADPGRNLVYLVDKTNKRVLAFNTDTNAFTAAAPLAGDPGSGFLAISPDHSKLYVALNVARKIQAFHLPSLAQADVVSVTFPIHSLEVGTDGFIYASSSDSWGQLRRVDPLTGAVTDSFDDGSIYPGAVVRTNGDHTRLFMIETGLSGGGGYTPEWDITGPMPVLVDRHGFDLSNTKDIRVDDQKRRLYFASGGVYGIGVTEMDTGLAGVRWHNDADYPYGCGLAFLPSDRFVYGLTPSAITRFHRESGQQSGEYEVADSGDVADRGLAITTNGRMLYVRTPYEKNSILGVVGGPAIKTALPVIAPINDAGAPIALREDNSTTVTASVVNGGNGGSLSHSWRILNGPGGAVFSNISSLQTDASFSKPGRYLVEVTSNTSGGKAGSDILVVDVQAAPPQVSVSASDEIAYLTNDNGGEFTFTRARGDLNQALVVNFTTSGTATSGVHYQPLGSTITIPAGAASATLRVNPTVSSLPSPRDVRVTVSPNLVYELGTSIDAGVTLRLRTYSDWKGEALAGQSAADSDAAADPDGDRRSNMMEYALGTDPLAMDEGQPVNVTFEIGQLCLTYSIPNGSGAVYVVQTSTDCATWLSGSPHVEELSRILQPDGSTVVKARRVQPAGTAGQAFIRLRIQ